MARRLRRYQGAIIRDHHILLVQHCEHAGGRTYWLLPGGTREDGESEEQAVTREMKEETSLDVKVERLLMEAPRSPGSDETHKTYLCTVLAGEARPGYEPEPEVAIYYRIAEVRWLDLRDEASWGEKVKADPYTYPELVKIREILGY
jgi:ADP-ribose pyrophosphatase YjhB (NUDIX family)